jgi:hypothetical protein
MIDNDCEPKINKELFIHTIYFIYKNHLSNYFKDPDDSGFFDIIGEIFDGYINKVYWKDRYRGIIPLSTFSSFLKNVLELVKKKIKYSGSFKYLRFI